MRPADPPQPSTETTVRRRLASSAGRSSASATELSAALQDVHAPPTGDARRRSIAGSPASPPSPPPPRARRHARRPALAARGALDQRALDTLADDHAWIDDLLGDLGDALGVLSFGLGAEAWWLGKASDLAAALEHVLTGQLVPRGAPAHPTRASAGSTPTSSDILRSETDARRRHRARALLAGLARRAHRRRRAGRRSTPWIPITSRLALAVAPQRLPALRRRRPRLTLAPGTWRVRVAIRDGSRPGTDRADAGVAGDRSSVASAPMASRTLSESESKGCSPRSASRWSPERRAATADDAVAAADALGYPVVAKLNGDAIAHKTERGLVRLGLADADAVRRAATRPARRGARPTTATSTCSSRRWSAATAS